jgi:hypothetical protein
MTDVPPSPIPSVIQDDGSGTAPGTTRSDDMAYMMWVVNRMSFVPVSIQFCVVTLEIPMVVIVWALFPSGDAGVPSVFVPVQTDVPIMVPVKSVSRA